MTSFTGYWLTRGRPHCIARWPSSSTESTSSRTREPNDSTNGPTAKLGQRSRRRLGASVPRGRPGTRARRAPPRTQRPGPRRSGARATAAPRAGTSQDRPPAGRRARARPGGSRSRARSRWRTPRSRSASRARGGSGRRVSPARSRTDARTDTSSPTTSGGCRCTRRGDRRQAVAGVNFEVGVRARSGARTRRTFPAPRHT